MQVRKYVKRVCHIQGQDELNGKLEEIKNFMLSGSMLDREEVLLSGGGLSFVKSGEGQSHQCHGRRNATQQCHVRRNNPR